ncbi:FAD-dependent oxidoreductase [Methylophilaceae bacterium]|nr:FAD-dependent oxidoreductase [Methylophilaceae bacterium]
MKIAIIGAGISAITIAQNLKDIANISLFEKSRGLGGRMALRRSGPYEFDHGAQFFTAKTKSFKEFIEPLIRKNIIKRWDARFAEFKKNKILRSVTWDSEYPHYVGVPGMNSIPEYLSKGLNIKLNVKISKIIKNTNYGWELFDDNLNNLGEFDWVISTAPAIQSAKILPGYFKYHNELMNKKMVGCFSLMLGFKKELPLLWDAALISDADISWVSVNSSKPDRVKSFSMLVHSTNAWAEKHLSDESQDVISYLTKETSEIIGYDTDQADHVALHAWKYANICKQPKSNLFIDYENKLASCGDWFIHGRIESAFEAGLMMAKEIKKNNNLK